MDACLMPRDTTKFLLRSCRSFSPAGTPAAGAAEVTPAAPAAVRSCPKPAGGMDVTLSRFAAFLRCCSRRSAAAKGSCESPDCSSHECITQAVMLHSTKARSL